MSPFSRKALTVAVGTRIGLLGLSIRDKFRRIHMSENFGCLKSVRSAHRRNP
jgi:hypothetical protein